MRCPDGAILCRGEVGVLRPRKLRAYNQPHESQAVHGLKFEDARARGRKNDQRCADFLSSRGRKMIVFLHPPPISQQVWTVFGGLALRGGFRVLVDSTPQRSACCILLYSCYTLNTLQSSISPPSEVSPIPKCVYQSLANICTHAAQ